MVKTCGVGERERREREEERLKVNLKVLSGPDFSTILLFSFPFPFYEKTITCLHECVRCQETKKITQE